MINTKSKKENGFALLYLMLVLASIIVALSLAANQSAFFSANRLKSYVSSSDTRMIGMYCGEKLLMQIRNDASLTGSGTLTYTGGSCTYDITGTVPNKTISIVALENNLYKKLTITTTQIYPTITSTWVETN